MSKKWAPAAAIVITSCFLAYLFQPGNEPEPGGASSPPPEGQPTEEKQTPGEETGSTKKEPGNSSQKLPAENTISGRIVAAAPAGASAEPLPLAGATISLLNQPRKSVKSAESGAFLLSPAARLANDLQVRAAGYGTVTRLRVPAGIEDLVIRLEKEFGLEGKTVFSDGSPAAGIEVLLHSATSVEADPFSRASALHGGRPPEAESTSGEDGSFTIGGLSQGDWFLRVRGPGIIEQVLDGVVKVNRETRPVEIVVERGHIIAGRVVDEAGKALAGIEVRLQAELDASISRTFSATTGSNGEFLFNRLAENPCELLAGASSDYLPLVISEVRPGQDLLIELAEGWVLNGKILDSKTSRPLPGVEALWESPETSAIPATDRQDRTDGEGNFSLRGLPPGDLQIRFSTPGYISQIVKVSKLRKNPPDGVHLIKLQAAGTLTGITRDEKGSPIADVHLRLEEGGLLGGVFSEAFSDSQGRFSLPLDSTTAGASCLVSTHHEDYLAADPVEIRIGNPRRSQEEITILLQSGGSISGSIKHEGESPSPALAGHRLMLLRAEEGQLIELKRSTLSRAGGEYSFTGLEAGEYVLRSDSAGFSPYQSERLSLPEKERLLHDIFFAGEKVISGRVTDTGGNPLRASISATDLRDPALLRSRRLTFSDQQGNFRLGSLGPGPYRISARTSGHQGATENSIAPPGNLDFSLVKNGRVEGEVVDQVTEKPVENFTAQLIPAGETEETTSRPREVSFNKPSGRFVIEELGGGNYELTITANGYLALSRAVTVKAAESADAGTLELSRGHSAEVSVTDPQGKPVAGCRIDVSRKAASEERVQGSFLTGAEGKCSISGISTGTWLLQASHPGFLAGQAVELEIKGQPGDPVPALKITLEAGAVIRGQINRATSPPARGEKLVLMGPGGPRTANPKQDGLYSFEGLAPGLYTLLHFSGRGLQGLPLEIRVQAGEKEIIRNPGGD